MTLLLTASLLSACGKTEEVPAVTTTVAETTTTAAKTEPAETVPEGYAYAEFTKGMPDGWLNAFDDTAVPLTAEYEWIRFTPFE